jgi:hypothetical protein
MATIRADARISAASPRIGRPVRAIDAGYPENDRRRTGGYVAFYRLEGETERFCPAATKGSGFP